jgi:hypothetical protein
MALRLLIRLGKRIAESHYRLRFERRNRRILSVVQLALRYLHHPAPRFALRP